MPSALNLRTTVLLRSEETAGQVSVTEIEVPPHTGGPPLHTHDFDEAFCLLEGELIFQVAGRTRHQGQGELSFAPRNVPTRSRITATGRRAICSSARRRATSATGLASRPRAPESSRRMGAAADPRGHGCRPPDRGARMRPLPAHARN